MAKQILILSSALDEPTINPIAKLLRGRSYDVVWYQADKVASGQATLTITVDAENGWSIQYNHQPIAADKIAAAWLRRPKLFRVSNAPTDRAALFSLDAERGASQQLLEDLVPIDRWLNAPDILRNQEAGHKLHQLLIAREVGFSIPTTLVSNEWSPIAETLDSRIVYKTFWGQRLGANRGYVIFTTPFENEGVGKPPIKGLPFPGIWQDNLLKEREWRVTVVGDRIFSAFIYHKDERTKDDWRRHSAASDLHWERGDFPEDAKHKCLEYCKRAQLRMGMFDFIETPEGELVFLECNPNGQYIWLEEELGFPISEAVSDELIKIAESEG